jgi:hypothetical protein
VKRDRLLVVVRIAELIEHREMIWLERRHRPDHLGRDQKIKSPSQASDGSPVDV